jgi:RND family efflux transporter MFP subunit
MFASHLAPLQIWTVGLLPSGLLAALCIGCGHHAPATDTAAKATPPEPIAVATVPVAARPWDLTVRSQGGLVADEATLIGAKVAGRVASVAVDVGDFVHQGDVLAKLDEQEPQLLVAQAEAQLAQACAAIGAKPDTPLDKLDKSKSPPVRQEFALLEEAQANLKRARQLEGQQAITTADLEQREAAVSVAEARYASALNGVEEKIALISVRRAELGLAKENLQHTTIVAPFDGLIQARQAAPGAYVRIGDPVAMVVRTDPLRFRGMVPERHALRVQAGQLVRIHLEGLTEPITARISRISPALDEASRALTFEADLPNPQGRLRTGLFAEADIVVDAQAETLAVPESAVTEFAGVEKVWLVKEGAAAERAVQTGRRHDGWIEIVQGLAAGDAIVKSAAEGRSGPVIPTGPEAVGGAE